LTGTADSKISRGALVALVVGSMIGAGIFTLPAAFGRTRCSASPRFRHCARCGPA
jgi:amino acid transporter